ncbi:uncharacterized protein [Triticum aestivum]|uniref:uncharacterized protein n=1 Tax=Triticum aestivum TaxID=4565 RepID=UPI001D01D70B|nr:uncharacterized protein LOC123154151 [Triticum aestivum]
MEQFHHGQHVRLRSRVHGTYLHADEDGHGVNLRVRWESMNAAWAVHRHPGEDGQFLLLHSAAYGHYLAATDVPAPPGHRGLRVEQRDYDHPEVEPLVWQDSPSSPSSSPPGRSCLPFHVRLGFPTPCCGRG